MHRRPYLPTIDTIHLRDRNTYDPTRYQPQSWPMGLAGCCEFSDHTLPCMSRSSSWARVECQLVHRHSSSAQQFWSSRIWSSVWRTQRLKEIFRNIFFEENSTFQEYFHNFFSGIYNYHKFCSSRIWSSVCRKQNLYLFRLHKCNLTC